MNFLPEGSSMTSEGLPSFAEPYTCAYSIEGVSAFLKRLPKRGAGSRGCVVPYNRACHRYLFAARARMPPRVVEAVLCILGPANRGSGGVCAAHMSAVGSHRISAARVRLKIDATAEHSSRL